MYRSKKWNNFDVWLIMLAGLSRNKNSKMEKLHVITTSNAVSALDMDGLDWWYKN